MQTESINKGPSQDTGRIVDEDLVINSFNSITQTYQHRAELLEIRKKQLYEKYKNHSSIREELPYLKALSAELKK
jgi:hypothetical protein